MAYLTRHDCCHTRKKVKSALNAGSHQGKYLRNTSQFKDTAALLKTNGHDSITSLLQKAQVLHKQTNTECHTLLKNAVRVELTNNSDLRFTTSSFGNSSVTDYTLKQVLNPDSVEGKKG